MPIQCRKYLLISHIALLRHQCTIAGDTFFVTNRDIQMLKVGINYRFNWSGYGYGYGYGR